MVERHLFPLTIGLQLLFLHLPSHLVEHLKELVFLLLRWLELAESSCSEMEAMSSACG